MDKYTELMVDLGKIIEEKKAKKEGLEDEDAALRKESLALEQEHFATQENIKWLEKQLTILQHYLKNKNDMKRSLSFLAFGLFLLLRVGLKGLIDVGALSSDIPQILLTGIPAITVVCATVSYYKKKTKEARIINKKYTAESLQSEIEEKKEKQEGLEQQKEENRGRRVENSESINKIRTEISDLYARIQEVESRKANATQRIYTEDVFEKKLNEAFAKEEGIMGLQRRKDEED